MSIPFAQRTVVDQYTLQFDSLLDFVSIKYTPPLSKPLSKHSGIRGCGVGTFPTPHTDSVVSPPHSEEIL